MKTMKAVVKYENQAGATELREVPVPEIGPQEVLVRTAYAGICGTDPHMHRNLHSFKLNVPVILGHEFSGTVEKAGSEVSGFAVGDRVTSETHAEYCGECNLCRTNQYHLCRDRKGFGFHTNGAFASFVKVPARILHRVPDSVSLREASLTEPLCVAYKALFSSSSVRPADTVVVIGPGPIGLFSVRIASLAGASTIVAIGTRGDDARLSLARRCGATIAIDGSREDPLPRIMSIGDRYGAHLVVDTAGSSQTLALSIAAVRPGGQITKIGWGPEPVALSLDPLIAKSATLKGHFSHTWDVWERCLTLIAGGQVDPKPLITHELPIDQWERGFELMESRQAVKVVLTPIG